MPDVSTFPHREGQTPAKKSTILIVEDLTSLRVLVSKYLMRHGYHIRTASDGQRALDILAREPIQVLLLDMMLPTVDGFEVLRQLREQEYERSPYIIATTALSEETVRIFELGGDEYLPKPFALPHLLERIQAIEAENKPSCSSRRKTCISSGNSPPSGMSFSGVPSLSRPSIISR